MCRTQTRYQGDCLGFKPQGCRAACGYRGDHINSANGAGQRGERAKSCKKKCAANATRGGISGKQMSSAFRCGFVAVVGRPNVGKSTLTNALIGSKISIVSRKAQTTRHRINGVLTREHEQFVFVDTPGFQTRHGGTMNRMMNRVVTQALAQVDVVVHVVEAGKWSAGDAQLLPLLPADGKTILVVNKVD